MKKEHLIFINNPGGKGRRLLFIGGRITIAPAHRESGFQGGFGMAASAPEKDYVHKVMKFANTVCKDSANCVISSEFFEDCFKSPNNVLKYYKDGKKFQPDVIIFQLGDYIPSTDYDKEKFENAFDLLCDYLDPENKITKLIITPYEARYAALDFQQIAEKRGLPCLYISDILSNGEYMPSAYDKLPTRLYLNDERMKEIAQAILCIIEKDLRK